MTVVRTALPATTEQTGDRQTLAMQDSTNKTRAALNAQGPSPSIIGPISFNVLDPPRSFNHKLGRIPTMWWVVDLTGNPSVFYRTAWDANTITLQTSATCTATFRVA